MSGDVEGKRRLVLCFDGTWSTGDHHTNASRVYRAIPDSRAGYDAQLKYYGAGLGTHGEDRFAAGVAGSGLDESVLDGYCWLVRHFRAAGTVADGEDGERFSDGDEIFLFGFSRGAYVARSLAGLINRCGIVRRDRVAAVEFGSAQASRSQQREVVTRLVARGGSSLALLQRAWRLYRDTRDPRSDARETHEAREFREQFAHPAKVRFIGVWETVGAYGVPIAPLGLAGALGGTLPWSRARHDFHDTSLGRVVENAFQALAIDEHRRLFEPTLWTGRHPRARQRVEQRWFPGSHSNVGGGYRGDRLCDPPLNWIAERAIESGLVFRHDAPDRLPLEFQLTGAEHLDPIRDAFTAFLGGAYRMARLGRRHFRPILTTGVNESVDETAWMRMRVDPDYAPANLLAAQERASHAGRPAEGAAPALAQQGQGMFWML